MTTPDANADDIFAITPTPRVKAAAGICILSGVFSFILALQSGVILQVRGIYQAVTPLFVLLGAGAILAGYRLARMRPGAAWFAVAAAAGVGLASLGWFIVAALSGVVLYLALLLAPLAGGAVLAATGCTLALERAAQARQRLRAEGLDSGL